MVTRRTLLAAAGSVSCLRAAGVPEVRLLVFAPSPYTERHDAMRAGFGILLSLRKIIAAHKLALRATMYDGIPVMEDSTRAKALVRGARVLVFGSSTWAQVVRPTISAASSNWWIWKTSPESPPRRGPPRAERTPGGELVIEDTLRTLMSMGAQVFSLGQKHMVFSTGERIAPAEGDFTLLDCWYMDHFARALAVAALGGGDPESARALSTRHRRASSVLGSDAQGRGRPGGVQRNAGVAERGGASAVRGVEEADGPARKIAAYVSGSASAFFLCLGFLRRDSGSIGRAAGTLPTRSRASARTPLVWLKPAFFFAIPYAVRAALAARSPLQSMVSTGPITNR